MNIEHNPVFLKDPVLLEQLQLMTRGAYYFVLMP